MRKLKLISATAGVLLVLYGLVWVSPYNYLIKGVKLTYLKGESSAHYLDWKGFDLRTVQNSPDKILKIQSAETAQSVELQSADLKQMLEKTHSGSYLVIKEGQLVCEKYYNGITDTSHQNSFSMAKTVVTLLTQIAIQKGYIASWDVPASSLIPWVGEGSADANWVKNLTLRHLSTMTAGLEYNEGYVSPLGITAKSYYSSNVESVMRSVPLIREPGSQFEYQSGATQLLGFALLAAISDESNEKNGRKRYGHIADFASEQLWQPLGMEASAFWSLDHENGNELAYCCVNAISRDFAKLGLMVLNHGEYNGQKIVDSAFLNMASKPFKMPNYGHSFWIAHQGKDAENDFHYFQGLNGQYIAIIPSKNMVVVRTGHGIDRGTDNDDRVFRCVKTYVDEAVKQFGK